MAVLSCIGVLLPEWYLAWRMGDMSPSIGGVSLLALGGGVWEKGCKWWWSFGQGQPAPFPPARSGGAL